MVHRDFGVAFWGKLMLQISVWAQLMVCMILTYERTGSATWVGVVAAAQMLPQLALALVSGAWSDRRGPARPVITGALIVAAGCLGLVLWLWVEPERSTSAAPLILSSVCVGVGGALSASALQALPPLLVRPDELSTAVGLNFIPTTLARTAGPVAGSGLTALAGPMVTLTVLTLAATLAAIAFRRMRGVGGLQANPPVSMRRVLHHVAHDRPLLAYLVGVAAVGSGSEAAVVLAPALSDQLNLGGLGPGWVTGAFGLGGVLGVVAHRYARRSLEPRAEGCVAMVVMALALILVGTWHESIAMTCGLVVGGAGMILGITAFSLGVQARSPASMLGRVMALWVIAFAGVRPLASVALGVCADHRSATFAMTGAALILLAFALLVFVASAVRHIPELTTHASNERWS